MKKKKEKEEWKKFADKFNVKTIAMLDSVLVGEDILRSEVPYIDGVITNLERGTLKKSTKLFECLRKTIMQKAITQGMEIRGAECLKDDDTINLRVVAENLDMVDENGNIKWDETRIKDIHDSALTAGTTHGTCHEKLSFMSAKACAAALCIIRKSVSAVIRNKPFGINLSTQCSHRVCCINLHTRQRLLEFSHTEFTGFNGAGTR